VIRSAYSESQSKLASDIASEGELKTAITFMVTGILPPVQSLSEYRSRNSLLTWDVALLLGLDYSQWAAGSTSATDSPINRIFDSLGSNPIQES
jgi:hypothetical protein